MTVSLAVEKLVKPTELSVAGNTNSGSNSVCGFSISICKTDVLHWSIVFVKSFLGRWRLCSLKSFVFTLNVAKKLFKYSTNSGFLNTLVGLANTNYPSNLKGVQSDFLSLIACISPIPKWIKMFLKIIVNNNSIIP